MMRGAKSKKPKSVRDTMSTFLRQLATFKTNNGAKIATVLKYQEELGPEWTTKVAASLDDIIREYQHLRDVLEAGTGKYEDRESTRMITLQQPDEKARR
jgi:hypothetical protein